MLSWPWKVFEIFLLSSTIWDSSSDTWPFFPRAEESLRIFVREFKGWDKFGKVGTRGKFSALFKVFRTGILGAGAGGFGGRFSW